ncbi:DUF1007 family protein [Aurantimonas sp. MSK8Z-1]|uniref:DUF1007 family protein n=1 Tax=Mangrovibrevibacter kandeliae TaxID=2968473 RepID=UPI002117DB9D|nr:DUF1007 family protein [Aurantimonas sp. MSK8Z-1]MCW4116369.1 DUF1007 family protein [Aurantimonas sp. MSK8Z-1]
MRRQIRRLALAGAMLLGSAGGALAHPHVFAEAHMEVVGAPDGTLAAVRNVWRMDEMFSSSVLVDYDKNANGTLDDDELEAVGETVRESIAEWDFYTFVTDAGRPVALKPPEAIHALYEDGQLLMFFEMQPASPLALKGRKLTFANFDETFFVAFDVPDGEGGFQLVDMPASCTKSVVVPDEDEAAKEWMNSIASLGPEQSVPDDGINYSQILATRMEVACG